jgi:protein translocase subunit secA
MFTSILKKIIGSSNERYLRKLEPLVARIAALEPQMQALSDEDFPAKINAWKEEVAGGRTWTTCCPSVSPWCARPGKEPLACATTTCRWWAAWCCIRGASPK